jgi:hypothetical protein
VLRSRRSLDLPDLDGRAFCDRGDFRRIGRGFFLVLIRANRGTVSVAGRAQALTEPVLSQQQGTGQQDEIQHDHPEGVGRDRDQEDRAAQPAGERR